MQLKTSRFGEIKIEEEKIITLTSGLVGFFGKKRYVVLDHPNKKEGPFRWLQSVEDPLLAFVITDPLLFKEDYEVVVSPEEISDLEISNVKEAVIAVIVNIPAADPSQMTANLQGPLVINYVKRLGKQIVLVGSDYTCRYRLINNNFQKAPLLTKEGQGVVA